MWFTEGKIRFQSVNQPGDPARGLVHPRLAAIVLSPFG
jgi:hypothetical protein